MATVTAIAFDASATALHVQDGQQMYILHAPLLLNCRFYMYHKSNNASWGTLDTTRLDLEQRGVLGEHPLAHEGLMLWRNKIAAPQLTA